MSAGKEPFKPTEHMRNLKGQAYLEVKHRIVWFREEHAEGYIATEMVEHNASEGLAVFKARAGYWTAEGRDVYATGYGSETRADFADYLEKSETKAAGRALAMLGYGTAAALDLDEGAVVDSPVEGTSGRAGAQGRRDTPAGRSARPGGTGGQRGASAGQGTGGAPRTLVPVPAPVDVEALRAEVIAALTQDAEAASKLPKTPEEMTEAELTKTMAWLTRRARALSS